MKFDTLNLDKKTIQNLSNLGFKDMTPIQEQSLPIILKKRDVIAKAKTGSGKTISFGLGVLNNLDTTLFDIQALLLCPTRELASQVANSLRDIFRHIPNIKILTLCGGVPYKPQVNSLYHKAHIVVGTPGRVFKHLENNNFDTSNINSLVLDEADRMLDMGFFDDIMQIIELLPKKRHTMLFSATYLNSIESLAKNITKDAIFIEVESTHTTSSIEQKFYDTLNISKDSLIPKLFNNDIKSVLIFCNTKIQCDELADNLEDQYSLEPLVLHSNLEQKDRDETLILFANKSYPILICTDLAARGLDIDDVDMVINYELPNDLENYTHRIGRTARAGKKGVSVSFIDNISIFEDLKEYLNMALKLNNISDLDKNSLYSIKTSYSTLYINGGKRHKLRAGDILGALTAGLGLDKNDIGKIDILPTCSYVAINNSVYEKAFKWLNSNKMKNRFFNIYKR